MLFGLAVAVLFEFEVFLVFFFFRMLFNISLYSLAFLRPSAASCALRWSLRGRLDPPGVLSLLTRVVVVVVAEEKEEEEEEEEEEEDDDDDKTDAAPLRLPLESANRASPSLKEEAPPGCPRARLISCATALPNLQLPGRPQELRRRTKSRFLAERSALSALAC